MCGSSASDANGRGGSVKAMKSSFQEVGCPVGKPMPADKTRQPESAGSKTFASLQSNDVESAIDEDVFAGDAARQVAEEEHGGFADFVGVDVSLERRLALDVIEHFVDPADGHRAER